MPSSGPRVALIVTTLKQVDKDMITELVLGKETAEENHNGKVIITSKNVGQKALHFVDDRTFVMTMPSDEEIPERSPQTRPQGPQAAALDLAAKKKIFVAGLNTIGAVPPEIRKAMTEQLKTERVSRDFPAGNLAPLIEVRTAALAIDLAENSRLQIQASLTFPDPQEAAEGLEAVQDGLAMVRLSGLAQLGQLFRISAVDAKNPSRPSWPY